MIKQCAVTDIQSRSECNCYDGSGFLPLITSNMYCTVDKHNAGIFLNNKIKVCMPRKEYMDESYQYCSDENYFDSFSLDDFIQDFIVTNDGFLYTPGGDKVKTSVCIDTAAGHLKRLHEAIREAKKIHGDDLIIMAGNVSSVEAFVELAKTGVDYIRVGIGGGSGCNTTNNTGVGQEDLGKLIKDCWSARYSVYRMTRGRLEAEMKVRTILGSEINPDLIEKYNLNKVKIVADGISSYIKLCQQKYNFNDNGYAAIIKLLNAGSDMVMIGGLFAQCVESAGQKAFKTINGDYRIDLPFNSLSLEEAIQLYFKQGNLYVKLSGMSTVEEQKKYNTYVPKIGDKFRIKRDIERGIDYLHTLVEIDDQQFYWHGNYGNGGKACGHLLESLIFNNHVQRPSEGSTKWLSVRFLLKEWLFGSDNQDEYPYLNGFINSLKSAMSYTGSRTLNEFKS